MLFKFLICFQKLWNIRYFSKFSEISVFFSKNYEICDTFQNFLKFPIFFKLWNIRYFSKFSEISHLLLKNYEIPDTFKIFRFFFQKFMKYLFIFFWNFRFFSKKINKYEIFQNFRFLFSKIMKYPILFKFVQCNKIRDWYQNFSPKFSPISTKNFSSPEHFVENF